MNLVRVVRFERTTRSIQSSYADQTALHTDSLSRNTQNENSFDVNLFLDLYGGTNGIRTRVFSVTERYTDHLYDSSKITGCLYFRQ